MDRAQHLEAFWAPGLDDDIDPDESLATALRWLTETERALGAVPSLAPRGFRGR